LTAVVSPKRLVTPTILISPFLVPDGI